MNKVVRGSFELMKQLNVSAVLKVIRDNGSLSRADVAKITGLTPASVTNITKMLIEDEYLVECKVGQSSGGRPPIMLELNPNARCVIGISIGVGMIDVVITNLSAEIILKKSIEINEERYDYDFVFKELVKLINEVIECSKIEKEKILGAGVALHGIVNARTGMSIYSPYYGWKEINIKEALENELNLGVYVDNDVRAMALGESWFGITKDISNFVTLNISNGIGAGIIINNKPYYGVDFSAGEIGHIVVEGDGDKCNCGNYGCLETVASNNNITKKAIKLIKQGTNSVLKELKADINQLTIEDISEAAKLEDELAISIIKEAARYIGIAITNLINILNPTSIVVVGEIFENTFYAIETLNEIVKNRGMKLSSENVRIIKSMLGRDAAVVGATTLVIQEIFNGMSIN
ncbi:MULTISPECIES: ROK family transcriptional regulator [Clostridium]|jgi:predicted NBD/HSP70 family sugar kinase|uniref:ROK family transcriptional regulator n=1 Tax=Clostridium TaxID=1485 RepID=UPI0004B24CEA|nr:MULTISPECIES: ROK family transcriptional regulator [Clostridium]MDU7453188.1 ROK family transcriptional regulator [Clostridium saudiense]CUO00287.1 xylose repressor XylR [Clostridium disporicum]